MFVINSKLSCQWIMMVSSFTCFILMGFVQNNKKKKRKTSAETSSKLFNYLSHSLWTVDWNIWYSDGTQG